MESRAAKILLEDAIKRDRTTARRAALVELLLQEGYLTREQIMVRIEGKLGKGCFGDAAWKDTFYRDMKVAKKALRAAGYQPAYSRRSKRPGYFLRDQARVSPKLVAVINGCVADVDRSQTEIFRRLTCAQRFWQGCSISNLARKVVVHRILQRNPDLNLAEAQRAALQGSSEA
jgi:hypothetical protein